MKLFWHFKLHTLTRRQTVHSRRSDHTARADWVKDELVVSYLLKPLQGRGRAQ